MRETVIPAVGDCRAAGPGDRRGVPSRGRMRPRRVAMLAHTYYLRDPRVRRAAEALYDAGYAVDVFCLRDVGESAHERVDGVRVFRLPLTRQRGGVARYIYEYAGFFALTAALVTGHHLARPYGVIHVHTHPDELVFAATLPRLLGARVLLDMHDPKPETLVSKYGGSMAHPRVRVAAVLEQAAVRYADHAVTVHEPLRRVFIGRGAPAERMGVVMNLTDPSLFTRREHMPDPARGRFVVIYAGTVAERYGLDLAVRAVATLRGDIPGLLLRIVGDGDQLPELRRMTRDLNVERHVEFIAPVPNHEVRRLLDDADAGISPHRPDVLFRLSLSHKVYEYVATGVPAVVPRTATFARYYPEDVVRFFAPGDTGDLARALLALYRSPEERRARIEAGWRHVERWNWSDQKTRLVGIVDSLVAGTCPSASGGAR